MTHTPPNPFDPHEVEKFLASKAEGAVGPTTRGEAEKVSEALTEASEAVAAPAVGAGDAAAVMGRADLIGADTPAAEAVTMLNYWSTQGPEVYAEAVGAIIDAITSTAAELGAADEPSRLDPDAVLTSARLGKTIEAAGKKLYSAGRVALWHVAGRSPGRRTTPGGGKYTFKAPLLTRTRVDSKRLKAEFPEVYAAVAKTTTTSPHTPGTLYL